jgi:NAD(P)-dependent dehydrogenase (short-subunit alcohol dehydrogenase family)
MIMSIKDKVIIITGGGSGMGADAGRAFLKAGAKIVLNGRNEAKLEAVASMLDPSLQSVAYLAGDIGDFSTSKGLAALALQRFGGLDILLNNAGVFDSKPFLDHSLEELDGYLHLLRGYFLMSQAGIELMLQRGSGCVINIGSMWANHAIEATPCAGSSTAKGGVHALTRNLALEFAARKIRVNCIAPAVVETPLFDNLLTPDQLASFNGFHPLRRNGQVSDITSAIMFFADETLSGWITGTVLPLDGGVTAGRNIM